MFEFNGCQQKYREYWVAANINHTMTQDEWKAWYSDHCAKCPMMSEICMADEVGAREIMICRS